MTARTLLLLLLPTAAAAAPTIVAPPLQPGQGVPAAIGAQFDISLRKALAKQGTLLGSAQTSAAMGKVGAAGNCNTDACGKQLAAETKSRFIVSSTVSSADEIYQVTLTVYDAGRSERSVVSGVCELCTAGEVNGTIETTVGKLGAALGKPAAPAAPVPQSLEVRSTPEGADIVVDGKVVGQTPKTLTVLPGQRVIELRKAGFVTSKATIIVKNKPASYVTKLKAAPPPVAAVPVSKPPAAAPVTAAPVAPPTVAAPVPAPANPALANASGKYNKVAWGMTIGGIALAGVGTWLIVLDGDVTCDDGRGRTTCPTVYNTKGVGIAGLGIGAALIGASVAIFAVGPKDDGAAAEPAGTAFDVLPGGGGMVRFGGSF